MHKIKAFCPLPCYYAVIQMDPVGMVKHYQDPIALAAAQAMRPKKYLVYLNMGLDLPTPTNPWFHFDILPIATTLRAEDPEHGITPDMVLPIYPNTYHPGTPREPIRTMPSFPFPNGYFWFNNNVTVRIRRKAVQYDHSTAFKCSAPQHMAIDRRFLDDHLTVDKFQQEHFAANQATVCGDNEPPLPDPRRRSQDTDASQRCKHNCEKRRADDIDTLPSHPDCADGDSDSSSISLGSMQSTPTSDDSLANILGADIFGLNVDDTVELVPLVDLWFELTDHLTSDTIPSPVELEKERDEIMRIIHDARERAPDGCSPSSFVDSGIEIDYDALSSIHTISTNAFIQMDNGEEGYYYEPPLAFNATGVAATATGPWCHLYHRATRLLRPIRWKVHPPWLPYWSRRLGVQTDGSSLGTRSPS
ncbi:hypothetical protein BD413DRAFT_472563 [Trametes elegans]|nr:hypothetical protein BD413DRAFT_472563 [Trametes elegans]